jgi:hypothetical protein
VYTAPSAERTKVEVTCRYAGPSKKGEAFISSLTAEAYKDLIGKWQSLLSQYLASKSMASKFLIHKLSLRQKDGFPMDCNLKVLALSNAYFH